MLHKPEHFGGLTLRGRPLRLLFLLSGLELCILEPSEAAVLRQEGASSLTEQTPLPSAPAGSARLERQDRRHLRRAKRLSSSHAAKTDSMEALLLKDLLEVNSAWAFFSQAPEEAPSPVLVVTAEEIERSGARTLGEALERCAGIDLVAESHLSIRGLGQVNWVGGVGNASRILLLIDGIRMNDAFSDSFAVGMERGVSDIERIEVIKGPGSALYGSGAFAGVVQVVTRRSIQTLETRMRLEGPSEGEVSSRGGISGAESDASFSVRGAVDGEDLLSAASSLEARAQVAYKSLAVSGGYLRLSVPTPEKEEGNSTNKREDPPPDSGNDPPNQPSPPEYNEGSAVVGRTWQEGYLTVQGELPLGSRLETSGRVAAVGRLASVPEQGVNAEEASVSCEARALARFTGKIIGVTGLELRKEGVLSRLNASDSPEHSLKREVMGGYAQLEVGPYFHSTLTLGTRLEQLTPSLDGVDGAKYRQLSPRVGFVSSPTSSTVVKVFLGDAFQAPSLSMLYYDSLVQDKEIQAVSTLEPELLRSLELEVSQAVTDRLTGRLNIFRHRITDILHLKATDDSNVLVFANATGVTTISGLEGEIRLLFTPSWQLSASGAFLEAEQEDGTPLPLVPHFRGHLILAASPLQNTSAFLALGYTSRRSGVEGDGLPKALELPASLRLDARMSLALTPRWLLALSVRNLLGEEVEDFANAALYTKEPTEAWLELTFRPAEARSRALVAEAL